MAERIDLDNELQAEPFAPAHLDQAIENCLAVAVAPKIVGGDKKRNTLGRSAAREVENLVGRDEVCG